MRSEERFLRRGDNEERLAQEPTVAPQAFVSRVVLYDDRVARSLSFYEFRSRLARCWGGEERGQQKNKIMEHVGTSEYTTHEKVRVSLFFIRPPHRKRLDSRFVGLFVGSSPAGLVLDINLVYTLFRLFFFYFLLALHHALSCSLFSPFLEFS